MENINACMFYILKKQGMICIDENQFSLISLPFLTTVASGLAGVPKDGRPRKDDTGWP